MAKPGDAEWIATHCSRCSGELDGEGWCPSYCTADDPPPVKVEVEEPPKTKPPDSI